MDRTGGWINGFLGVLIFSGSLPATRVAVANFDPLFLTVARAAIAGILALCLLLAFREKRPGRADLLSLLVVSLGVVIGFPLLTAFALKHITSAHSTVFIGLLPLATAVFGVLRGGERPRPVFWLFSCLGSAIVAGFALMREDAASSVGDLLMLAAIIVCGLGYAEGGGCRASWAAGRLFPGRSFSRCRSCSCCHSSSCRRPSRMQQARLGSVLLMSLSSAC